jgi:hypothetical protein
VPVRNNNVDGTTDRQIRYVTDTDNRSSGPPLLTDDWVVFASAVCPLSALRPRPDPVVARPQPGCPVITTLEVDHVHHPCLYITRPTGLVMYG